MDRRSSVARGVRTSARNDLVGTNRNHVDHIRGKSGGLGRTASVDDGSQLVSTVHLLAAWVARIVDKVAVAWDGVVYWASVDEI